MGDRVLVRGKAGADAHSIVAGAVVVMKQSDVAAKQQKDRDDWQKRGVGGLRDGGRSATGNITISNHVVHRYEDSRRSYHEAARCSGAMLRIP